MKTTVRLLSYAAFALFLLPHFSSQDSTVSGGAKPAVNFHGKVTDLRESFKAENITVDRLYKAIPAYQQPPLEEKQTAVKSEEEKEKTISAKADEKSVVARPYDPADNITRLDLSEINKITIDPHQSPRRFGSRDYIVIDVYSNDKEKTKNSYMIEADKRLFFDQVNPAGPIEKEIKLRAVHSIEVEGYKQQPAPTKEKKDSKPVQAAQARTSKTKRLLSYVKNAFGLRVTL